MLCSVTRVTPTNRSVAASALHHHQKRRKKVMKIRSRLIEKKKLKQRILSYKNQLVIVVIRKMKVMKIRSRLIEKRKLQQRILSQKNQLVIRKIILANWYKSCQIMTSVDMSACQHFWMNFFLILEKSIFFLIFEWIFFKSSFLMNFF